MTLSDRRHHPRIPVERPAKLLVEGSGRYCPAVVINVSDSGALIRLLSSPGLPPDATVHLGLAPVPGQAVIGRSDMIPARVVRSLGYEDSAHVGLRFDAERPGMSADARAALRVA